MPTPLRRPATPICNCPTMNAWLARMGASGSTEDLEAHFREEERFAFPVLIRAGYRREVEVLANDHRIFRRQLRELGRVDPRQFAVHAKFEDALVKRYLKDA